MLTKHEMIVCFFKIEKKLAFIWVSLHRKDIHFAIAFLYQKNVCSILDFKNIVNYLFPLGGILPDLMLLCYLTTERSFEATE